MGRSVSMLVSRSGLSWCLTSSRSAMLVVSCFLILLIVVSCSSMVVLFGCSIVLPLSVVLFTTYCLLYYHYLFLSMFIS